MSMSTKSLVLGLAVAASLGSTASAASIVLNGGFEQSSYPLGTPAADILNPDHGSITDWTVHGAGATINEWNSVYIDGAVSGLTAFMPAQYALCQTSGGFVSGAVCADPDGAGYFINLDGDPAFPAAISQAIGGLVKGQEYALTFSWAAVQRNDESGSTTESLQVSLGTSLVTTTPTISLPAQGFSGWLTTTYDFTWDGASNVLTFLAQGGPSGLPPQHKPRRRFAGCGS
jgi:hypothetical protein